MKNELKPCPFCGGEATVYFAPGNRLMNIPCFGVVCKACHVMIGTARDNQTDFFRSDAEAAEAWNRRPV